MPPTGTRGQLAAHLGQKLIAPRLLLLAGIFHLRRNCLAVPQSASGFPKCGDSFLIHRESNSLILLRHELNGDQAYALIPPKRPMLQYLKSRIIYWISVSLRRRKTKGL